jgi:hypothetical protein
LAFVGALIVALLIFLLLICARIVYVPPVMMVEGQGVFGAIGRSFSLAGGEVRKIAALLIFNFYVAWSLYWLLVIPLGWYGYWTGLDIMPFSSETPLWFNVTQQTLTQLSELLLAPIALLGFTLLYLDSRIRKEGFDVELLANRVLPPAASAPAPPAEPAPPAPAPPPQPAVPPSFTGMPQAEAAEMIEVATLAPEEGRETAHGFARREPLEELTEVVNIPPPLIVRTINPPGSQFESRAEATTATVTPAARAEAAQRFCPHCGSGVESGNRFCLVCGEIL